MLKTQDPADAARESNDQILLTSLASTVDAALEASSETCNAFTLLRDAAAENVNRESMRNGLQSPNKLNDINADDFSWDIIALGLEEPLPQQSVINELYVANHATQHTFSHAYIS